MAKLVGRMATSMESCGCCEADGRERAVWCEARLVAQRVSLRLHVPGKGNCSFGRGGMTRKVQSGQAGVSLFLSRYLTIVDEAGVQNGQTTNYVCPLCYVHVHEWAANVVCVPVLVSNCWVENQ